MARVVHNSRVNAYGIYRDDRGAEIDDNESIWDESTEYNSSNVSETSSVSSIDIDDFVDANFEIDTASSEYLEVDYQEAPKRNNKRTGNSRLERNQTGGVSRTTRNRNASRVSPAPNLSNDSTDLRKGKRRPTSKGNRDPLYNDIGKDHEEKANKQTYYVAVGIVVFGAIVCAVVVIGFFFYPFEDMLVSFGREPTTRPTLEPSPTIQAPSDSLKPTKTAAPTRYPTLRPSVTPSRYPTLRPSLMPSSTTRPSVFPTWKPSFTPSSNPSISPTSSKMPTMAPTITDSPTPQPPPTVSMSPSDRPSHEPSSSPTSGPSNFPTGQPSNFPSRRPTPFPTLFPTPFPTPFPTLLPTPFPTPFPTLFPTPFPTNEKSRIENLLTSVALLEGEEFKNPDSYQSKALAWLEADLSSDAGSFTDDEITQRYAVACIWFATNGVSNFYASDEEIENGWGNNDNWMSSLTECTWYGITCDDSNRVNATDLRQNRVTGTFPNEVVLLAESLVYLDLGNNNIHNRNEQTDFLGELKNLEYLDIGETYFEYPGIPPALGYLTNLQVLDVSYTYFYGPIRGPEVFANLQKLRIIEMGGNEYNQEIPSEIARLPELTNFYCDNAALTGTLDFIELMPVIFELWIDINPDMSGSIPTSIGTKFRTLESLSLTENNLTGRIPTEMGNLRYMQALWLYDNDLTGTIPSSLDQLEYMYEFDVSGNQLQGIIPNGICSLTGIDGMLDYDALIVRRFDVVVVVAVPLLRAETRKLSCLSYATRNL
eukprot:CAMPEP_0178935198 /NCGR_PEP_ID=MMETSP0786-20121207/24367_1 /TAXON_ID=186022 /ORGANISM="Thalassionema frauenfeldii, Strain CCMP 1798" /LENGTH=764 /DNA_ID=CAMNT_0020613229 /DNA_START=20 /DNA_END=2315 /DNA_ORIENTATION=+